LSISRLLCHMSTKKIETILKDVFGYEEFHLLQREIIENVLRRKDTLVIMPTGGGKSLCYQIPALLFEGLTVVISPLISLMKDQVDQLGELGIESVFLNSSLSSEEYQRNVGRIVRGEVRLLYLAPETLLMEKTLALLASQQVDCLTIDEAHCISEWGHDFRPEYRQLAEIRKRFPKSVCLALTATATTRVRQDIKLSLRFEKSNEFIASFNRPNLFLEISPKENPLIQTVQFVKEFPDQSGIIYCFSRRQVDELAEVLGNQGFSVKPYHAGLSDIERRHNQESFIRDDTQIMVATIAFGMGINKPNIRFILHYDLPKNIEGYYQQIGRAGRDGLKAHCLLLFGYSDIQKIQYFIRQKESLEQKVANIQLNALVGLAETDQCRRIPMLRYFDEEYATPECGMCDNCTAEEQPVVDVTMPVRSFLRCVELTGQKFGTGHIIDVLRGSRSKKVARFNHNDLATYGTGKDYSKKQWFHLSRQFIQKRLLTQNPEFGNLTIAPNGREVLRGEESFWAKVEERQDTYARCDRGDGDVCDSVLFELLRQKRKMLADDADLPPYVVFPDKTLIEMAAFFPQSREGLLQLHGVGSVKMERYGQPFLDLICDYCQEHHIEAKSKRNAVRVVTVKSETAAKPRHIVVGEEFNSGKSVAELLKEFNVKLVTILNHLYKYLAEGYSLRHDAEFLSISELSTARRSAVLKAFDRLGTERLKPVFDALDDQVSYDELHLLRMHYVIENREKPVEWKPGS
jgi:ATP-dependent DNA helicase RecQ